MKSCAALTATLLLLVSTVHAGELDERIYQGLPARRGQFPYLVRLDQQDKNGTNYLCSGQLISDEWVLVAAHCAEGTVHATAGLGQVLDIIFNVTGNIVLQYDIEESNIHIHPDWDSSKIINDLALYRLSGKVPLDKYSYIKTIALPKTTDVPVTNFDNNQATAVGWGAYTDSKNQPNHILRYGPVNIQKHSKCQTLVSSTTTAQVSDSQICTDKSKTIYGACPGDSGGPLVVQRNGKPTTIGIASYITGACSANRPVVYTFVPQYLQWIHDTTGIEIS